MSSRKTRTKLSRYLLKNNVHKAHKCSWCICETKWYHYKLIMSIPCSKGCHMNVFILYSHLMVTRPQVNLGKYLLSSHLVKDVMNPRKKIFILHSDFVQLSVINTQPECTIFLFHKQNWCSPRGHTCYHILLLQQLLQLHL